MITTVIQIVRQQVVVDNTITSTIAQITQVQRALGIPGIPGVDGVDLSGNVTGPSSSIAGHLASFSDTTGKNLEDGGPARPHVVSFALAGTVATFLALLADETIDIIEMASGTYTWATVDVDIARVHPVIIRPVDGGTVTFSGAITSEDQRGQFEFGEGANQCSNMDFEGPFIFTGYTLGQIGIIWMQNVRHLKFNNVTVVSSSYGASGGPYTSWAVYISSTSAGYHSEDVELNDWTVDCGAKVLSALQVIGGRNITAARWKVTGAWFAIYATPEYGVALSNFFVEDWEVDVSGNASGFAVYFNEVAGRYTNIRLLSADMIIRNIGDITMASGSGDVVGPSEATDNAIARYDAESGKLVQDSMAAIDDTGKMTIQQALRIEKPSSDAYVDVVAGDAVMYFDGNDADGFMDYVFLSNGVPKMSLYGLLGNLAIVGSLTSRIARRVDSQVTTDQITPEISTYDIFIRTTQAHALAIYNHSTSVPVNGDMILFEILGDATPRAISYDTMYVAKAGVPLPATTDASKNLTMLFIWRNDLTQWVLLSVGREA